MKNNLERNSLKSDICIWRIYVRTQVRSLYVLHRTTVGSGHQFVRHWYIVRS